MPSNRAFTLLELLVVITIIGILASIVVVSMSGSTDSATIAKGKAYAQQVHALLGHEAVLDLNFNEGTYGTCPDGSDVCDASGYGNNGTFYGDTQFVDSDIEGYALSFDGVDDYVDVGSGADITNAVTIEAWFNTNTLSAPDGHRMVFYGGEPSGSSYLSLYPATPYFRLYIDGVGSGLSSGFSPSINIWYHLVANWDTDKMRIYINGTLKNTSISYSGALNMTGTKYIGRYGSASSYFSGLIDEVRIYAEALPATEIQEHYVQGLENLLVNQAITQTEYDQRMEEFNKYLASNRF
jgi:prepilin-type N-terminal cleavage/methylation domain-containing protein